MSIIKTKLLHPITSPEQIDKIDESLSWAVRCQMKPRWSEEITLFKLEKWVAVPVISESSIDSMEKERRQQTLLARGYRELWAVGLCNRYVPPYTVPVTLEGLEEFRQEMGFLYDCALFAGQPEPDWVLISIDSELDVIAGQADFIRQFLNCEIEEAFFRFQNYVVHEPMPKQLRQYLQLVHDRLKGNYQSASVGAEFRLTP
ncbi:MAG: hypothetical protein CLLPBCKN_002187 [Chroococcidiopsis cubana SAG 39.79]|uniref:Phycobilisome protein n=1 Tax=Chroococcidiopsis cubana SAG 39.79 TaxID=388085 RepID=A0AB37UG09_9CYAN|nr:hypothetical protein [Chroococcidiopsis cubana]MDZ4872791.1 hypothetical protein [Chroococcidiopsis cubana SAG 39.79]PSB63601.1 hypothetical protein C7B79_13230 [Chroococcidiopsis cubana CCALA 043]RUT09279.1 hypothetical protein DSM107010_45750 [Chroococcidiopsis cubana SAG 39.79]